MNVFIFQSVPDRFDLDEELKAGENDTWYATRYRKVMRPGDIVFFWMAGDSPKKGLYGWGTLMSEPYILPEWKSHGVDIVYKVRFRSRISKEKLANSKRLKNMLLFRAPQATNFLLSDEEVETLISIIKDAGEKAPSWEVTDER